MLCQGQYCKTGTALQCWTGPYKNVFVGPGTAGDGKKVGSNFLLIEVFVRMSLVGRSMQGFPCIAVKSVTIFMREQKDRNFCHGL